MPTQAVTPAPTPALTDAVPAVHHSPPPPGFRTALTLGLTTSVLLYLCYFPVAWGWLGWVALVPFLALIRTPSARHAYPAAYLAGLAFFVPVLQWLRVADPMMYFTWIALSLYVAVYFPVALLFLRLLDRRTRLPLTLTLPLVWVPLELARAHLLTGFAWYFLGHTQHDVLPLIQIADVTGAYGVSFLVAAVNGLIFEVLFARAWFRRLAYPGEVAPRYGRLALLAQSLAVLVAFLGVFGYGLFRLAQTDFMPGPRVALLQSNLPQSIRNTEPRGESSTAHYRQLLDTAILHKPKVDLIVWPETSFPAEWDALADDLPRDRYPPNWDKLDADNRKLTTAAAEGCGTAVLLGLNSNVYQTDGEHRYNSALLIDRTGRVAGRYDKVHRVPFGEYVPLRNVFPWLKAFAPYKFDYSISVGQAFTRFPLEARDDGQSWTFGVVICYEDTDPEMARPYGGGDQGPPADFLLNTSNDGWFKGTSEHDEHLAICRFRAVECRRSVARAVNMGISALIDGNGKVLRPTVIDKPNPAFWLVSSESGALPVSEWHWHKGVAAVLFAEVPIDSRSSFYARWGDWMPWVCAGVVVLLLLAPRRIRSVA